MNVYIDDRMNLEAALLWQKRALNGVSYLDAFYLVRVGPWALSCSSSLHLRGEDRAIRNQVPGSHTFTSSSTSGPVATRILLIAHTCSVGSYREPLGELGRKKHILSRPTFSSPIFVSLCFTLSYQKPWFISTSRSRLEKDLRERSRRLARARHEEADLRARRTAFVRSRLCASLGRRLHPRRRAFGRLARERAKVLGVGRNSCVWRAARSRSRPVLVGAHS
jgi:hypothetical protein